MESECLKDTDIRKYQELNKNICQSFRDLGFNVEYILLYEDYQRDIDEINEKLKKDENFGKFKYSDEDINKDIDILKQNGLVLDVNNGKYYKITRKDREKLSSKDSGYNDFWPQSDILDEEVLIARDGGLSLGRNIMVKKTITKYFCVLDDDTMFKKEGTANLVKMVRFLEEK